MTRTVSNVLRGLGVLLLLFLAYNGISGSIEQYPGIHSTGQRLQTAFQLGFGVLSLLAVIVAFRATRWRRVVFAGFIVSTTLAAGLAVTAWGQQGLGPALAACGAAVLVCWLIVWLVGPHNRTTTTSAPVS